MPKPIKAILKIEVNGIKYKIPYPSRNAAIKAANQWAKMKGIEGKVVCQ